MNYKDFTLGDWIGHISGVIEDESELDGNEMRDLVEFLTTLKQEPILDKIRAEIEELDRYYDNDYFSSNNCPMYKCNEVLLIIDKYRTESEKE